MAWTIDQMQSLINKMIRDRERITSEWNQNFPPNAEVDVDEDIEILDQLHLVRYGIWKVEDGFIIIVKSKKGYYPENKRYISIEVFQAMLEIHSRKEREDITGDFKR